jgi:hypothetical protein
MTFSAPTGELSGHAPHVLGRHSHHQQLAILYDLV